MGKKTGQKTQILLRLDKDPELLEMFERIKGKTGIHSNADLIRTLINQKYEELKSKEVILPRFEQINSDEDGVKIHDRTLRKVVEVYIKRKGIRCSHDQTDRCEHVTFALTLPEVKAQIMKHRKEGWKLPEV
jgi:hypothetical protein